MEKEVVIHTLKNFYSESHRLWQQENQQGLRELYLATCEKLADMMPVEYRGIQNLRSISKKSERIIVVANHITTPGFFTIKDQDFVAELGVDINDLDWKDLRANILRHYPIVNLLANEKYYPTVFALDDGTNFANFARGWGQILIDKTAKGRFGLLRDAVKFHPHDRLGVVIFPEGTDSPEYLPENKYVLEDFKSGFAVLAHEFKLPVLPLSMTFDLKELVYTVRVNEPLTPDLDIEDMRNAAQKSVMDGILNNLE